MSRPSFLSRPGIPVRFPRSRQCILLLLLLSQVSRLRAQPLIDPQLIQPVQHAIATNYELNNQLLEAGKTHLNAEEVKGKALPEISASALYAFFYNRGTLDLPTVTLPITGLELFKGSQTFSAQGNIATTGIHATQVIFSGLQISNAVKALEEKSKAQAYLADASKESIAKDVILSFDQLMLLDEVGRLIDDSQKRLDKETEYVTAAIANGLAIPYDRDKIKLAGLELQAKKTELEGNRKLLQQKLVQLTHLPDGQIGDIKYSLSSMLVSNNAGIENKPELQALKSSGNAYNYLLKKEKGAALPQVFAFGSASYLNVFSSKLTVNDVGTLGDVGLKLNQLSLFPNVLVGAGVKFTIYSGGHLRHKVQEARLDVDMNKNKLADAREKLALLLQKNQVEYETANDMIKVKDQQVKVARNNLDIAGKQYREGLIGITERLAAENELFSASLGYYAQLVQQRRSALEILHTTGSLLNSILK